MPTPNVNILLTPTLSSYDNLVANTPLLAMLNPGSLPFGASAYFYNEYFQANGAINLPVPTCYVLWVRNRDAAANITIAPAFTLFGVQQTTIGPGDLYVFFNVSKVNGFTGLTLSGGPALCEVYIAG